jgi:hypothetical protein
MMIMSEVVLLLINTDRLQQVDVYGSSGTTSTTYWPHSTSWRWCQRLYYFYQILTAFNTLNILYHVVLLLPNTDRLQEVEEDYGRDCTTSTIYQNDHLQQVEHFVTCCSTLRLSQRLFHSYEILAAYNKLEIISDVGLLLRNTDRLQQVEDYVRGCTTSTKTLTAFNKLKTMSEVVLLLPNSYRIKQVEDYVRDCTTSTKYWLPSTSWRLCQRWYYFYQILATFNKLKIMSKIVFLLQNTDCLQQVKDYVSDYTTSTKCWPISISWKLCQRLYYFYQILTTCNKLKIMSEIVLLPNTDRLKQFDDYLRGFTWQLKKVRIILQIPWISCWLRKRSLECFNRATPNCGLHRLA